MPKRRQSDREYFSNMFGQFLEGGDENSQGYIVIVVFVILVAIIVFSYFNPGSGDPF